MGKLASRKSQEAQLASASVQVEHSSGAACQAMQVCLAAKVQAGDRDSRGIRKL